MKIINGKVVVSGISIGVVKFLKNLVHETMEKYHQDDEQAENQKFHQVLQTAKAELQAIINHAKQDDEVVRADIMEAHLLMLSDSVLLTDIEAGIARKLSAPQSVSDACEKYAAVFASMQEGYFQERAADLRDIKMRLLRLLLEIEEVTFTDDTIICADDITPSLMAALPKEKVKGIILAQGSALSHSSIIAKARNIITIVGIQAGLALMREQDTVIIDGDSGRIICRPDEAILKKYELRLMEYIEQQQKDLSQTHRPAVTLDGVRLHVAANIGMMQDMDGVLSCGAEGVGLFRTEFLYLGRDNVPDEEEQFNIYRQIIEKCGQNMCIIRTMDIGGDKQLPYLNRANEENPFLGCRGIRLSLKIPELLITQFKAILRASRYGRAAVMLPMVISLNEICQAKRYFAQAKALLEQEGQQYKKDISFGIMVETPAAAIIADTLALECDFFSIGTNDLGQYTLAVDRVNSGVSDLYDYFHPAVLRLIYNTIKAAHRQGIPVGMCGEMAADPLAIPLLIAMGIDEVSMSLAAIPGIKSLIRSLRVQELKHIVTKVLELEDGEHVRKVLKTYS